jgi:FAD dependent oxidoreductase
MAGQDQDRDRERDAQAYINAAKIEGYPNVYAIGPFGRRLNFASQQRRALNTIWALEYSKKVQLEAKTVAVVGGGLAGITAAAALAARKSLVHLYERYQDVLCIQSLASHRYVHPTANFWPESKISPTTQFPFLDWYADDCDEIIKRLRDEWRTVLVKRIYEPKFYSKVTGLIPCDQQKQKWRLEINGKETDEVHDLIILSVGFGEEGTISGADSKSYWSANDELDRPHEMPWEGFVSGTGDGGIIDALRAVHGHFDNGRLCLQVIRLLESTGIKAKLLELELQGESSPDSLSAGYPRLINESRIPLVFDLLEASLKKKGSPTISLVGKGASPFSKNSAPIHKFMLAHAMDRGVIRYECGTFEDGPALVRGAKKLDHCENVIVRHGPARDLSKLIVPKEAVKALEDNQNSLNTLPLDDAGIGADYWFDDSDDCPRRDLASPDFIGNRFPAAYDFMHDNFKLVLEVNTENNADMHYRARPRSSSVDAAKKQAMPMPSDLFGIRLEIHSAHERRF